MQILKINDFEYKVIETLPWRHSGVKAKVVATKNGNRVAVMENGAWVFVTSPYPRSKGII